MTLASSVIPAVVNTRFDKQQGQACRQLKAYLKSTLQNMHHSCGVFANHGIDFAGGCKDLDLMQRLAKESNVPLPLADIIMSHEREAERQGNGNKDWGCIADVIREKAGLGER